MGGINQVVCRHSSRIQLNSSKPCRGVPGLLGGLTDNSITLKRVKFGKIELMRSIQFFIHSL